MKLLDSAGWGSSGLYIRGSVMLYPDSGIKCIEPMLPDIWYRIILSRAKDGTVSLYLNGYL
eukprot:768213-Hanusia_phi.AAC.2